MSKISEDINPWTSRLRQTFLEGTTPPKSLHPALKQNSITTPLNKPRPNINNGFSISRIFPHPTSFDWIQPSHTSQYRIPKRSQQFAMESNIEKTPIRHKIISFELKTKDVQQKKKEKHLPFNLNNLRQYTQEMTVNSLNHLNQKVDLPECKKILRVKRYFTEEKNYSDDESKQFTNKSEVKEKRTRQTQLSLIHHSQQIRRKRIIGIKFVKFVRTKKQMLSTDDIAKQEKLYQQIRHLCDSNKNSITGHLSLMKRNYNLQKLQKILQNEQSIPIKVNGD